MNQTFNYHRFAMMLKIDFIEKGKTYLLTGALLLFAMLLMMVPAAMVTQFSPFREFLHYLALVIVLLFGVSLFSGSAFSQYSSPSTGIAALMLPASRLEKFLSSFTLNLLFIVPFLILFFQLHYLIYDIANKNLINPEPKYRYIPLDYVRYACYCYFLIQAAFFVGSIYFKKASYLKTAAIFAVIGFTLAVLNYMLSSRLTGEPTQLRSYPFTGWQLWYYPTPEKPSLYSSTYYQVLPPKPFVLLNQLFVAMLVILLWAAAYFQMKERQI